MSATRLGRIQKATTILPLVLLSAAWTVSLTGLGPTAATSAAGSLAPEVSLPGGATVPSEATQAPASVSSPEEITSGFPDDTSAAGFLNPLPGFTPNGQQSTGPSAPSRTPSSNAAPGGNANAAPGGAGSTGTTPPTTPTTDAPAPTPAATNGPGTTTDNIDGGGATVAPVTAPPVEAPPIEVPPVTVPPLPDTGVDPVDDVLTLAEALAQCTLDGLVDNPLSSTDRYDQCVADYTTN